ncbi:MAG: arginase family protein [Planctomycetota bacterium]|jgi:arginase
METALVKMPYTGSRNVPELSPGPDWVDQPALRALLREAGAEVIEETVRLDDDQESAYGSWHRMGLACGRLATIVAEHARHERFVVGLLGNCTSLLGMLGGLQRGGDSGELRRVGLLFLDAHADFNTPETTLSGMLGGMPVAVAAGLCLSRLRRESHLRLGMPGDCLMLAGLRDVDAEERVLLEREEIVALPIGDLRDGSPAFRVALDALAEQVETLYVHVDLDVLDPAEVPGHHTPVPGGLSSVELADRLREIVAHRRVEAIGIASTPAGDRDPDGVARAAAHRLVAAVVETRCERRQPALDA